MGRPNKVTIESLRTCLKDKDYRISKLERQLRNGRVLRWSAFGYAMGIIFLGVGLYSVYHQLEHGYWHDGFDYFALVVPVSIGVFLVFAFTVYMVDEWR